MVRYITGGEGAHHMVVQGQNRFRVLEFLAGWPFLVARVQYVAEKDELEGGKLHAEFDRLLAGWRDQGYELCSLKTLYESLDASALPKSEVVLGEVPGRSGTLALQASFPQ